jgi:small subunit ribosomal protein S20
MSIIKSSIKNNKINKRNNSQNRNYKNLIKLRIKNYLNSLNNFKILQNKKKIEDILKTTYSCIDKAVKKKIIHKNKALRNKIKLKKKLIEFTNFKN